MDEELKRQNVKNPSNIPQGEVPVIIENDTPAAQPSYEPRQSPRIALPTYHHANSVLFVNKDAVYKMLAHTMEQPKEWVPRSIQAQRK